MKSQNVFSAMSEVLDHFISEEGMGGSFDKMLEVLLDVTQSEYGFIGEVLNDEEQPYLKTRAITNISWSKETAEFYEKNAPQGLEFKNLKTLFGKVITDQEPIISNDPYNDPKRGGLPPGHPRMNCFLGLPFFNGNEMIGMVGIANKPSGYTEDDIKLLAPFLSTCSTLTTAMRNEVKKARAEQSAKKFSEIVAHSSDAIISTDNNGIVVSWNLGAESLLGYSADEMLGTPIYKIGPRLLKKEHDEVLETVKKGESIESYETLQLSKNGELMHVNMAIFPTKDREGKVTGISSILRDISVQKEAEKIKDEFTKSLEKEVKERTTDLEETQKELMLSLKKEQELGELKSRFVSIASHQFRTPLAIIAANFGLLDMLGENSDAEFNEKFKKIYSRVDEQIQNMTLLMDQALILGKINANSIKLERSSVNMVEACEDIIRNINEIQQDGRSTDFTVIGKNENVCTDLRLLDQAVSNILSNAFKYSSGKKNPEFELHLASEFFRIRVKDFGIGIPEDEMDKLFDPFFRASNVREISGTGLGTAIAKEYIELIGGEVSVISKEGQGTEFTITFLRIDL